MTLPAQNINARKNHYAYLKNREIFQMESLGDCVQAALAKNGTGEHTTTNGVEFLIDRLSNDIKKPQRQDNRKTPNFNISVSDQHSSLLQLSCFSKHQNETLAVKIKTAFFTYTQLRGSPKQFFQLIKFDEQALPKVFFVIHFMPEIAINNQC